MLLKRRWEHGLPSFICSEALIGGNASSTELAQNWHRIGTELAQNWHRIGTELAQNWPWSQCCVEASLLSMFIATTLA
jgi:hypothetical protein